MAVGHWVVHGGPKHSDPQPVTVDLLAERYIAEHGDDRPEIGGWRWPSPSPTTD